MGVYMGIFNFFIVIPEILISLTLEPVVKNLFGNDPVKVVMMGGASLLVAAVLTQFVQERAEVSTQYLARIDEGEPDPSLGVS